MSPTTDSGQFHLTLAEILLPVYVFGLPNVSNLCVWFALCVLPVYLVCLMCLTCVFGLPCVSYLCFWFALCALPVHLVCDFCRVGDVFMLSLCVTSVSFFFNVYDVSVYWRVVHAL